MSRITFAAEILRPLAPKSVLDVGCRDGELADHLPETEYAGADLFAAPRVTYVGDVSALDLNRSFDAIVACDILEHLNDPSVVFDRLVSHAERHMLISLPNCYDLKHIYKMAKGQLGGKYSFKEETPLDRHHWLMSRSEIFEFAKAKAAKHKLDLKLSEMQYGTGQSPWAPIGRFVSAVFPSRFSTETVFALFSR